MKGRSPLSRALAVALPLAVASLSVSSRALSQPVEESIARGVALYRGLSFAEAAAALRRALATPEAARLPDSARAQALTYVGAAEIHLGRVPRGEVAFRDALARAPRFRIDTLEFPPAVSVVFEESRSRTSFVVARTARDTTLLVGRGRFEFRLASSAPHTINVAVCDASGGVVRRLYHGAIGDTLVVAWDGLDALRAKPVEGTLGLCVESIGYDAVPRQLRLPLRVSIVPPASARPVPAAVRTPFPTRDLGVVIGSAAAAALLHQLVSRSAPPSDRRFVVSGAIITAAIVGRWSGWSGERRAGTPPARPAPQPRPAIRLRVEALRDAVRTEAP